MATNTVRSVVIFSVIAIGFIGLATGGMFFLKSRNHTLATVNTAPTPQKQNPAATDQSKKDVAKTDENKSSSTFKNDDKKTDDKPVAATKPATPTPAPAPDNKKAEDQTAAVPTAVPATGPSLPGMITTMILMMAAAFFGGQLVRARNTYRRHLEG